MDASRSKFTPCSPYKIYPKWNWVDLVSFLGISSRPHLLPLSLAFLSAPGFFLQATCFLFCLFLLQASIQFPNLFFSWMLILTLPVFPSHTGIQVHTWLLQQVISSAWLLSPCHYLFVHLCSVSFHSAFSMFQAEGCSILVKAALTP